MSILSKKLRLLVLGLFMAPLYVGALNHLVKENDTLFGLSLKYDVSMDLIRRANGLSGNGIRSGQYLEIPTNGLEALEIRPGDTLSSIALAFNVDAEEIKQINGLVDDSLHIGQILEIPPPVPNGSYRVRSGDTLSAISLRYNVEIDRIRAYNGLHSDSIRPGQILVLENSRPEGHRVTVGESLWSIAVEYGLSMDDIKEWNDIDDDVIHPGELLALYPGISPEFMDAPARLTNPINVDVELAKVSGNRTADAPAADPAIPRIGEYFFTAPRREIQPNTTYWEEPTAPSLTDFRRAASILKEFDREISQLTPLSDTLKGRHIVIDPGHGGLDPGAIVAVEDGNGNPVVITEDEYAFDIAMRMYRELKRHGASVSLTILSPDHHVRDGENARQTFVHRKNEVYNQEAHNGNAAWRPVGTKDGLDLRKTIAGEQIAALPGHAKRRGTLFVSIHADNSPDLPAGRAVLFDGASDAERSASRAFAAVMASNLGAGAFMKEQPLRVLRNNPADAAILVEARNIYYDRNAWALRAVDLREQDALMIVDGILAWERAN